MEILTQSTQMAEKTPLIAAEGVSETYNLVVVGDGAVGKTCMLLSYAKGEFPEGYVPTIFENYVVTVQLGNRSIDLSLKDTAGQEEMASVRKLSYHGAHVFLVCFSIINPTSYENVEPQWVRDIKSFDASIPFVIVGTCMDLRNDEKTLTTLKSRNKRPITYEEGLALKHRVGAFAYVECSAKTRENLQQVFEQAVSAILTGSGKTARKKSASGGDTTTTSSGCCVLL